MNDFANCKKEIGDFLEKYCFQKNIYKRIDKCILQIAVDKYDFGSRQYDTLYHCYYIVKKIAEKQRILFLNEFIKKSLIKMKDKRMARIIYSKYIKGYSWRKCEETFKISHTTLARYLDKGIDCLALRLIRLENNLNG